MTISGFFGDEDALFFEIGLVDDEGLELQVDAMFDTGFSYWLALTDLRCGEQKVSPTTKFPSDRPLWKSLRSTEYISSPSPKYEMISPRQSPLRFYSAQ